MLDPTTLTGIHTLLSLAAILTGIVAVAALLGAAPHPFWTHLFLATAVATSVTGFFFPFSGLLPSHVVGGLALAVLAAVLAGRYAFDLAGAWRAIYKVGLVVSLYFLVFVGIAQAFLKVPALHALAPTGTEPPFVIAQSALLIVTVLVAIRSVRRRRAAMA